MKATIVVNVDEENVNNPLMDPSSEDGDLLISSEDEVLGGIESRIITSFAKAFAKQNIHFEKAIHSLDALNDQILEFIFSPNPVNHDETLHNSNLNHGDVQLQEDPIKAAINLMRHLLLDAQSKFRKMVEENKNLSGRLDSDLTSANHQLAVLRAELNETNRRLSSGPLSSSSSTPSSPSHPQPSTPNGVNTLGNPNTLTGSNSNLLTNGISNNGPHRGDDDPGLDINSMSLEELRLEFQQACLENNSLRKEIQNGATSTTELQQAKEALSALKGDRKRLKAEKFELLNQMKELYSTLEEKEKELRDFIRNYEQRMRESETTQLRLVTERDEAERERWTILRHARDEAERGIALATQLNLRENQVQQLQEELLEAKRQLSQYGIYSEPDRSTSSTNATSHYSIVSALTATYATLGESRSSADSGVRLSSDRDSSNQAAGRVMGTSSSVHGGGNLSDSPNEGASLDLGDGSGNEDSMSVISTATLPQLYNTTHDSPGPITFASLTRSLDTNNLSRSAEQLLAAEARRKNSSGRRVTGVESVNRMTSSGPKGAWGSISRVFARNKNRRTLDSSAYDSMHGGGAGGQRSSWSPQGSGLQSPLTEQESYVDKLRALEEAATLPMELWRASMVQAWVEVSLGMPQYGGRCGDNVKSGKVLLELSDADLESELGIAHPLHRKKLRLAIEEHRNPALVRFPCIVELSHVWVSSEWLPDIGLPQYAENFAGGLVDARLLDHLSKKDLEKYLGVTRKFHLAAIAHGVHLLRMVAFDRQHLAERRRHCEGDPLVWTNHHFLQWARSIDLNEYAENLKGCGVHGAFAVLEPSFNGDTLASAMGIPTSKHIIRRHLSAELETILVPARAKITQQYRVTTPRYSTLEKQRSDSLGRSAPPPTSTTTALANDNFRRSTDDSRRRTSLRFSTWRSSQGSLSRALGLKLKTDLGNQRQDSNTTTTNYEHGSSSSSSNNHARLNEDGIDKTGITTGPSPIHYIPFHNSRSILSNDKSRLDQELLQSTRDHKSERDMVTIGSCTILSSNNSNSPESQNQSHQSSVSRTPPKLPPTLIGIKKHRRTASTSGSGAIVDQPPMLAHLPVHTPV